MCCCAFQLQGLREGLGKPLVLRKGDDVRACVRGGGGCALVEGTMRLCEGRLTRGHRFVTVISSFTAVRSRCIFTKPYFLPCLTQLITQIYTAPWFKKANSEAEERGCR